MSIKFGIIYIITWHFNILLHPRDVKKLYYFNLKIVSVYNKHDIFVFHCYYNI